MDLIALATRVRFLARDPDSAAFTDDDVLAAINMAVADAGAQLRNIQSSLVYTSYSISTVDGTRTYQLGSTDGYVPDIDGVRLGDNGDVLDLMAEHDLAAFGSTETGAPTRYYLTRPIAGITDIGFWPLPDAVYAITVFGSTIPVAYTALDTTVVPYGGLWAQWIACEAAILLRDQVESNPGYLIAQLDTAYRLAMADTYRRGIRALTANPRSEWFSVDGGVI